MAPRPAARSEDPQQDEGGDVWLGELRQLIERRAQDVGGERTRAPAPASSAAAPSASTIVRRAPSPRPGRAVSKPSPRPQPTARAPRPHASAPAGVAELSTQRGPDPRSASVDPILPSHPRSRGRARAVGPEQLSREQPRITDTGSFTWDERWPTMKDAVASEAIRYSGRASAPSRGSASVK
ncbi:MAG: hypothetical protein ACRDTD_32640, partial [Pseudonocardiaceae bacterium]